eukprot:1106997-Rhodomonas_salina.2
MTHDAAPGTFGRRCDAPCPEQFFWSNTPSITVLGFPSHPEHVELSPWHTSQASYSAPPSGTPVQSVGSSDALKIPSRSTKHSRKLWHTVALPVAASRVQMALSAADPAACRTPLPDHVPLASSQRTQAATAVGLNGVGSTSPDNRSPSLKWSIGIRTTASREVPKGVSIEFGV